MKCHTNQSTKSVQKRLNMFSLRYQNYGCTCGGHSVHVAFDSIARDLIIQWKEKRDKPPLKEKRLFMYSVMIGELPTFSL